MGTTSADICYGSNPPCTNGYYFAIRPPVFPYDSLRLLRGYAEINTPLPRNLDTCSGGARAGSPTSSGLLIGNPIHAATGDKAERVVDYAAVGDDPLEFTRVSHSQGPAFFGPLIGWTGTLNRQLLPSPEDRPPELHFLRPDGGLITFIPAVGQDGKWQPAYADSGARLSVRASGGWILQTEGGEMEEYDGAGPVRRVTQANGRSVEFNWTNPRDSWHLQATTIKSNFGRSLKFSYRKEDNPQGYTLTHIELPDQSLIAYDVDFRSKTLGGVRYPGGQRETYGYNERQQLRTISDNDGLRATFDYDEFGRAYASSHGESRLNLHTIEFNDIDTTNLNSVVTDPLKTARTYRYTRILDRDRLLSVSQPGGSGCGPSASALSYDANANISSRTDFSNRKACYAYDQVANQQKNLESVRVEGLLGSATCPADLMGYQVLGDLPLEQPQRKVTTRWHPAWRLPVQQAEPLRITSWVYNGQPDPGNGNKPLSCAPDNAVLPDGQPIVVLCKRIEQATIDASGSKGLQASAQGQPRQWSYTYNRFGQKLTEVDPRNKTSRWEYFNDTNADHTIGDLRSTTNAAGQTSHYSRYDKAGRLLTMSDANGVVTQYEYTPRGWLKSVSVNPPSGGGASEVTGYDHYPTGLLKLATLPDGSTLKYDYDDAHRLTDVTDSADNTVHYSLDEMGKRKGEELKDKSGALARSITRIFDALNRLQTVTGAPQ
jgi:YD repeat-containing protein